VPRPTEPACPRTKIYGVTSNNAIIWLRVSNQSSVEDVFSLYVNQLGLQVETSCLSIVLIPGDEPTGTRKCTAYDTVRGTTTACLHLRLFANEKEERLASRLHGYRDRPGREEEKLVW
jgi:hypothetical protein